MHYPRYTLFAAPSVNNFSLNQIPLDLARASGIPTLSPRATAIREVRQLQKIYLIKVFPPKNYRAPCARRLEAASFASLSF